MRSNGFPELIILLCLVTGAACMRFMVASNNDKSGLTDMMARLNAVKNQLQCLIHCRTEAAISDRQNSAALCIHRKCTSHSPSTPKRLPSTSRLFLSTALQQEHRQPSVAAHIAAQDDDEYSGVRGKRWQYSDPLQVCTNRHCQGLERVAFYQCVFRKCISEEEEEEER